MAQQLNPALYGLVASNAIDRDFNKFSSAADGEYSEDVWRLELGYDVEIHSIKVYNRVAKCTHIRDRIFNSTLCVMRNGTAPKLECIHDKNFKWSKNIRYQFYFEFLFNPPVTGSEIFSAKNTKHKWFDNSLNTAEVQVFGR